MTECLDEEAILSFCRGSMAAERRLSVEAHMVGCDECRALISAVARSSLVSPREAPERAKQGDPVNASTTSVQGGLGAKVAFATPRSSPPFSLPPVRAGDVLAGKYRVERVLGAGGMGVVVAARHTQLEQRFALKFLLPSACEVPGATARFLREGRAAAAITSEHVARVVDTGVLESGAPYLVMEFLEGSDLGVLVGRGPLDPAEAVDYVLQACEAIVEAHQLGIVHRDLKPANLFLTRRKDGSPLVKVLDFGISKAEGGSQKQLTSTSTLMGSPRYMSPEQMISAKDVDARTDIWSLGVILYELVTGKPVWTADTLQGLCALIATAPTPSLRAHAPHAPALLEEVVSRCLVKSAAQRLASVADLALALAPIAPEAARTSIDRILRVAGRTRDALAARAPSMAPAAPALASPPASGTTGAGSRASGARLVLLVGAGLAALALAGVALDAFVMRPDARREPDRARAPANAAVSIAPVPSTTSSPATATTPVPSIGLAEPSPPAPLPARPIHEIASPAIEKPAVKAAVAPRVPPAPSSPKAAATPTIAPAAATAAAPMSPPVEPPSRALSDRK